MKYVLRTVLVILSLAVLTLAAARLTAWWREDQTAAVLAPENGRMVETSMGVLHVSLWGRENSTTVVMTHGMAAWGGLWEETAAVLAGSGYRVVAMDQPPFGFSERGDPDFSRSRQAERVNALAEAMELEDYLMVGHSYGGGVAMEAALRFPGRLAGLVLVCPVMKLNRPGAPVSSESVPFPLWLAWLGEALVSMTITNPLLTDFLTKRFMHKKSALTDRHVDILQKPMKLHGNTENMVVWLRQFLAGDPHAKSRNREHLKALDVPVTLIWGESDTVTPIAQGEELAGIVKPNRFIRLADIGHMPQLEDPGLFNTHLLDALGSLRR